MRTETNKKALKELSKSVILIYKAVKLMESAVLEIEKTEIKRHGNPVPTKKRMYKKWTKKK